MKENENGEGARLLGGGGCRTGILVVKAVLSRRSSVFGDNNQAEIVFWLGSVKGSEV